MPKLANDDMLNFILRELAETPFLCAAICLINRHRALQEYLAGSAALHLGHVELLVNIAHDDRWRDTIILAAGGYDVGPQDAIRLIKSLINRGESKHELKICFAIAVACLETAKGKVDTATQDMAIEKLEELIPPHNSQEAKVLFAAGDAVVEMLSYEKAIEDGNTETAVACAMTLSRIGSDKARCQLRNGYLKDSGETVILQALECPGIHPFEAEIITNGFSRNKKIQLPVVAVSFLKNLGQLDQWREITTVNLSGCRNLRDIDQLSSLMELRSLCLRGCEGLSSLAPLRSLNQLERVDLSYCPDRLDVEPVYGLPSRPVVEWLDRPDVERLKPTEPSDDPME